MLKSPRVASTPSKTEFAPSFIIVKSSVTRVHFGRWLEDHSGTPKTGTAAVMGRGEFFQIDRNIWPRVCEIGLNSAVAYLVLASGTGADNRKTSWSVHAVERYTAMGRARAKRAIELLVTAGLIVVAKGEHPQSAPRYSLLSAAEIRPRIRGAPPEPDWMWLPNSLVQGTSGETPPIERLRRLHDVQIMRMFIEFYHHQALADDGGLPWRLIRKTYKRTRITERGRWVIWGFEGGPLMTGPQFHWWKNWPRKPDGGYVFWDCWRQLAATGLLERVPHLVEADTDEAAIIFPCPIEDHGADGGTRVERELGMAAHEAVAALMGDSLPM